MSLEKWSGRLSELLDEIDDAGYDAVNMVMNMARNYVEEQGEEASGDSENAVIWTFDDGIDLVMVLVPSDECSGALNANLH